ncbi:MAG: DUF4145 domain-containing protein [Bacteroidetes bacterium]|nr:DUF4145 domain-containing protein [Bacteroidota bacterium]
MQAMETITTECPSCLNPTKHNIHYSITKLDADLPYDYENTFSIIECNGCTNISMLYKVRDLKDNEIEEVNYPDAHLYKISEIDRFFLKPDVLKQVPKIIQSLYKEVKDAFNSQSPILSGIGLRTLVEAICIEQNIAGRDLKTKIENLHKQGFISNTELPLIDKLRLIGNVSAHEIKTIQISTLVLAVEIVNHILKSIYILPNINNQINI